ncbi:integrase [Vibrio penaeicida]|uniref:Integrase n=2 Tax=Vibrio penaeicida TaxID=104609 RepID=A0AAV5NLS4_9VIBR|nr:integrase [Vibrio penaeicida]
MELALLNLAIDCKLRSCDLLRMKVRGISSGGVIQDRVLYSQSKTGREVQFEITSRTAQCAERNYARTKNIRAVQLLLGHVKLDNTIRYLGVEIEDALNISENTDS